MKRYSPDKIGCILPDAVCLAPPTFKQANFLVMGVADDKKTTSVFMINLTFPRKTFFLFHDDVHFFKAVVKCDSLLRIFSDLNPDILKFALP